MGAEQRRLLDAVEKHQNADQSYMEEGVGFLELAQRAAELFEKQESREKRRLLNFVLSNCSWKDGELTPEFRQPFEMIAVEATALQAKRPPEAPPTTFVSLGVAEGTRTPDTQIHNLVL